MTHTPPNQWITFAVTAIIIAIVLAIRLPRMMRLRPLKPEMLWIVPGIYLVIVSFVFWSQPLRSPLGWGLCALGLAAGAAFGWQRGRLTHISVHPEDGTLMQKASPAAVIFLVALILIRNGARQFAVYEGGGPEVAILATDVLLVFALGMLTVQRIEMYLRARRLLDRARPA
ncbi:CcdC protein domain-containing protein [Sphingomonas sp.]|uniref:CcdC protein domain-containing protein n=1 Tax=Sphingomonas sp. TaxID=28214 RepID=UPI001B29895C|nr:CcdC protein domain-containing protein [Sphingomonas sp.]MBO9711362.1 DUF1453 family protein [Sphingomonas sp.]